VGSLSQTAGGPRHHETRPNGEHYARPLLSYRETAYNFSGLLYSDIQQKATSSDPDAQIALSIMHATSEELPKDLCKAEKWYRKAAAHNYSKAEYNLGLMYATGAGMQKNPIEAAKWFDRAAEKGVALAQFQLGNLYVVGTGVPQDYVTAHMLFNLAGSRGLSEGIKNRKSVAKLMNDAQIAEAQGLARNWRAKSNRGRNSSNTNVSVD
jgi:hypothetical protein